MDRGDEFTLDLGSGLAAAGMLGSWVHDMVSDRVIADARLANLFGIDCPDLANGDAIGRYTEAVHPDDREAFTAEIDRASRLGSSFACHYRVVVGENTRWVSDFGSFILDAYGHPRQGRGIIIDLTNTMTRDICTNETSTWPTPQLYRQIVNLADHVIGAGVLAKKLASPRLINLTAPLLWETGRLIARMSLQPPQRRRRPRRA